MTHRRIQEDPNPHLRWQLPKQKYYLCSTGTVLQVTVLYITGTVLQQVTVLYITGTVLEQAAVLYITGTVLQQFTIIETPSENTKFMSPL